MLSECLNKNIVVQTTNNPVQGKLTQVMPDYIVVTVQRTPFYIRMEKIVWITKSSYREE